MEISTNEDALVENENAEKVTDPIEICKKQSEEEGEIPDEAESNKVAVDEEDVPDDFFDDFSNQDFMDGLDIVDAWDDSDKVAKANKEKERKAKDRKKSGKNPITGEREKRKRRSDRSHEHLHDKARRSEESDKHKEISPHKKRSEIEFRRDPFKTKRDLEKDRENYVKKKEQKLISKVVETGLVPPGMEMEVDIFDIDKVSKDKKLDREIEKTKRDIPKSKEKSREKSRETRWRRSRSFSPIYRNRDRSMERWRARRERSRERIRRTRSRERSIGRIIRDTSPYTSHRRRRSISDRERWLQNRRSESPERKYKDKIGEEKLSFLEEIKMKLDGLPSNKSASNYSYATPVQQNYLLPTPNIYPNHPMMQPTPIQPPAPQYFPNPNSPYDQNFFIGDAQPVPPVIHNPLQIPSPILPLRLDIAQTAPTLDIVRNVQHPNPPIRPVPPPVSTPVAKGLSEVAKLMEQIRATANNTNKPEAEEKKLSLTDYLSINKKPTAYSTNSEAFKRKINVLSRCQDVLNEFSGDKRPGGKLIVRKCGGKNETVPQSKNRYKSPLLRRLPVEFSYSSVEDTSQDTTFQSALGKVLTKCGLVRHQQQHQIVISDDEDEEELVAPKPPEISTSRFFKQKTVFRGRPESPIRVLMKMCQTDPISCDECTERKKIKYKDVGVQCGESDRYNVGVQVIEADILNSRIGKNQSLAYLTPAQLLGRSEPTSTKIDNFRNPFVKPTPSPDYRDYSHRDPRGYVMQYPDALYPGSAIRDPRFPRF